MAEDTGVYEGEPTIEILQSQLDPMIREKAETMAKEVAEGRIALLRSENAALESQLRESRLEVRTAHGVNENLQAMIDELKLGGDGGDFLMAEQAAALHVADNHRARLEAENDRLTSTISTMKATENCLHGHVRDLKQQLSSEKEALAT